MRKLILKSERTGSEQVLCHYGARLPLALHNVACDASPYGNGSVLSHVMEDNSERPIAFASRSLTKAEQGYSQIDKEALALHCTEVPRLLVRSTLYARHIPVFSLSNSSRAFY